MSNSYLPDDLLVLVLIRLPPIFVGRFKCVSKSWNALISSSEFIRFHLQYQSTIQIFVYRLLTKLVDGLSHQTHLAEYSINGWPDSENLEIGCRIQRIYNPYQVDAPGMTSMLVGSCNGLLCQILCYGNNLKIKKIGKYGEFDISLWNPITKSSRVLPKSPLFLKDEGRRVAFYGFGYDDVHDTYKVILGTGPLRDEYEYRREEVLPPANYEYEVYSLRSNSWIIVSSNSHLADYFVRRQDWNIDGVLINCALHWILTNYHPSGNKKMNYILAFDLGADKQYILQLPEVKEDEYNDLILSELNACLLLSDNTMQNAEFIFDMWVMKDYGLRDSWTKIQILNSSYYLSRITPVALLESDEDNDHQYTRSKLIYHDTRVSNGTRLLSYDIESRHVVELPSPQADGHFLPETKQVQFVGSLVQPHPSSSEDNERS